MGAGSGAVSKYLERDVIAISVWTRPEALLIMSVRSPYGYRFILYVIFDHASDAQNSENQISFLCH